MRIIRNLQRDVVEDSHNNGRNANGRRHMRLWLRDNVRRRQHRWRFHSETVQSRRQHIHISLVISADRLSVRRIERRRRFFPQMEFCRPERRSVYYSPLTGLLMKTFLSNFSHLLRTSRLRICCPQRSRLYHSYVIRLYINFATGWFYSVAFTLLTATTWLRQQRVVSPVQVGLL